VGFFGVRIFGQIQDLELGTESALEFTWLQGVGGIGQAGADLSARRVQEGVHDQESAVAQGTTGWLEDGAIEVVCVEDEVERLRRELEELRQRKPEST